MSVSSGETTDYTGSTDCRVDNWDYVGEFCFEYGVKVGR